MIELKITGNYATDLMAEVRTLAVIMGLFENVEAPSEKAIEAFIAQEQVNDEPVTRKSTLNKKEQEQAVREMVDAGEKDDRFEMLSKGRQAAVESALEQPAEEVEPEETVEEVVEDDLDDMFDDDKVEAPKDVTREEISKLMGDVCKRSNGTGIAPRLIAVKKILVDNVPKGQDIKVRSLPDDKLNEVYALIQAVKEVEDDEA